MLFEPNYIKDLHAFTIKAHHDQLYGNEPYMSHVLTVVENTKEILSARGMSYDSDYWKYVAVAYAHDIVEDTKITVRDLANLGLSDDIVQGVLCITKMVGETRDKYITKVKSNKYSHLVKQADSLSNLTCSVREDNKRRVNKYTKYLAMLSE